MGTAYRATTSGRGCVVINIRGVVDCSPLFRTDGFPVPVPVPVPVSVDVGVGVGALMFLVVIGRW